VLAQIKQFLWVRRIDVLTAFIIILVAGAAFGLGRLSVIYGQQSDFKIIQTPTTAP
jgi:hypothetical protein